MDYLDVLTSGPEALAFLKESLPKSLSFVLMVHKFLREFLKIVFVLRYIFYHHKNSTTMKNVFKKPVKANIDECGVIKAMDYIQIHNSNPPFIIYGLNQNRLK